MRRAEAGDDDLVVSVRVAVRTARAHALAEWGE